MKHELEIYAGHFGTGPLNSERYYLGVLADSKAHAVLKIEKILVHQLEAIKEIDPNKIHKVKMLDAEEGAKTG